MNIWKIIKNLVLVSLLSCNSVNGERVTKESNKKTFDAIIEGYADDCFAEVSFPKDYNARVTKSLLEIYCIKSDDDLMVVIDYGAFMQFILSARTTPQTFTIFSINNDTKKIEDRLDVNVKVPEPKQYLPIKDVKFSSDWTKPDKTENPTQIMILSIQDGAKIRKIAVFLNTKDGRTGEITGPVVIASLVYRSSFGDSELCPLAFELDEGGTKTFKLETGSIIKVTYNADEVTSVEYKRKRRLPLPGVRAEHDAPITTSGIKYDNFDYKEEVSQ